MENYTKNGLLLILIGLIISVIGTVIFGLYLSLNPVKNVEDVFQFIPLAIIGAIGGLISFIGAILFLIGRKEFGKKHQQFVIYALICIVVGIIISIGISIVSTIIMITGSEGGTIPSISTASIVAPTIASSITGGLAYVFSLYHLEDENGRKLLYIAFGVSIVIAVIIAILSAGTIEEMKTEMSYDPEDISSITSFTSAISEFSVYGSISTLLWAIAVYLPYKRIQNGELIPQIIEQGGSASSIPERVCPNCGKAIPTDAQNCPYCGKQFENYL